MNLQIELESGLQQSDHDPGLFALDRDGAHGRRRRDLLRDLHFRDLEKVYQDV